MCTAACAGAEGQVAMCGAAEMGLVAVGWGEALWVKMGA